MLWGRYSAKIDDKSRLRLPAKFRRDLPETSDNTYYVTSDDGKCAQIYPIPVWERVAQKFQEPPRMDPANWSRNLASSERPLFMLLRRSVPACVTSRWLP